MSSSPKQKRKRRNADPPHKHEEELWLISYADMMTLLFGFFVILYSFSTLDEKKFSKVSEQMAKALGNKDDQKSNDASTMLSDENERLRYMTLLVSMMNMGSIDEVMSKVQKQADRDAVLDAARAVLEGDGDGKDRKKALEVDMPADQLFAPGAATLLPKGAQRLKDVARRLRQVTDLVDVNIESHTDTRPPTAGRAFTNNWALSAARAGAVAEALAGLGIDRAKLRTRGYGDTQPLFPERTPSGVPLEKNRERNRRIAIILTRATHAGN